MNFEVRPSYILGHFSGAVDPAWKKYMAIIEYALLFIFISYIYPFIMNEYLMTIMHSLYSHQLQYAGLILDLRPDIVTK